VAIFSPEFMEYRDFGLKSRLRRNHAQAYPQVVWIIQKFLFDPWVASHSWSTQEQCRASPAQRDIGSRIDGSLD
jgi:hypothetical protein